MKPKINFFTCCNKIYNNFIPLFILSNLYNNDNSFVEVCTDELEFEPISKSVEILRKYYTDRFIIRKVNFGYVEIDGKKHNLIPNSVRFIVTPEIKSDFVYISDIDIITLQKNISDIHINNMEKTKLPYSNIVRPKKNINGEFSRLSGLHFTPYSNYYPIPDLSEIITPGLLNHDEGLLYKIVEVRYPNFNLQETFRPVHGIHISLNRNPTDSLGWGMEKWKKEWVEFRNSEIFREVELYLPKFIIEKINIIDNHFE